ncbi:antitoxin [Corynebacterium epidermidicanis]|uniref:Antitoxin protein n=1 Tax=Corynebacterium epidermidicanis TaxID=1050174 RepID=A0A0G3GT87_9CORY|nr:antitoxin [Corynebacterium epidermidicanis]AKK02072.1 antitoxin protein [Corynebacterium epidermidicanis]
MGIFDSAKDLAAQHPDKVDLGVEKLGDAVDAKTDGKHAEHVDRAQDLARDHLTGTAATPGEAPAEDPVGEEPLPEAADPENAG